MLFDCDYYIMGPNERDIPSEAAQRPLRFRIVLLTESATDIRQNLQMLGNGTIQFLAKYKATAKKANR